MTTTKSMTANFELREYLKPGGFRSYEKLFPDLENARQRGFTVYLWGCAGHFILSGHPGDELGDRPWHDGEGFWYKTAKDASDHRNGLNMEQA